MKNNDKVGAMMKHILLPSFALFIAALSGTVDQAQTDTPQKMNESPKLEKKLTIDRLFGAPSLNGLSPTGVKYSPDGQRVTFLKGKADAPARYDLWQFDVKTGEQSLLVDSRLLEPEDVELSEEEKALRERKRIAGRKGIVSYDWGTSDTILVPIGGDLWLVTLTEDKPIVKQLTQTEAFEYDARVSPAGNFVSFIRDGAVYVIDLSTGEEKRISPEAEPEKAISYGVAEFVAQEEMSRYTGYWWSPDEAYIAYTKVDESTVDIIPRFDIAADKVTVINQRYPRAGRPNAIVDLFVHDMGTNEAAQIDQAGPDTYLTRVHWLGAELQYQIINRDQNRITFKFASSADWSASTGYRQSAKSWINLSDDFFPFREGALKTDEKSGYRHIVYHRHGVGPGQNITEGDWVVTAIEGVDSDKDLIFFTGFKDTPLEKHLYMVSADGGEPVRLTEMGKSWSVQMSPDGKSFVGTSSAPDHPPQTGLYKVPQLPSADELKKTGRELLPGQPCVDEKPKAALLTKTCFPTELIAWIEENKLAETHPYFPFLKAHTKPEFGTLIAEDGQTLHYSIQKPPEFDPNKKYPVIVEVYGGPHVQTVTRNWERLTDVFYTHQGYIVFRLDNRGSYNRGKKFEDVIYHQTGAPEVRDQLKGVEWLKSQPFVDADKIAIQGWSYGGYMTLMTLLQAEPGTFAAAVSGAPVTDWTLYDTFYTERYMGTPQNNAEGYEKSSVFYHLKNWQGDLPPLLLIHGMADDNVTFDNSTRFMAEMQQRGMVFELMTYPGQRHGIRGEALQQHLMKTRMEFLNRKLKGE